MPVVIQRTSKQAPPPWRVYDALVDELAAWWITLNNKTVPRVIKSRRPQMVTWSSPFTRWPGGDVQFRLAAGAGGCIVEMEQTIEEPMHDRDRAALRHRWGEHLGRDLREWLDDGYRTDPSQFSPYRLDGDDWSILDRIKEGQFWRIDDDVFARVELDLGGLYWHGGDHTLPKGTLLFVVGFKYHRMAVHCVVEEPSDLEGRVVTEPYRQSPRYRGYEVIVPVAKFCQHIHLYEPQ